MYVSAGLQSGHTFAGPARFTNLAHTLEILLLHDLLDVVGHQLHALANVVLIFLDLVCCAFQDLADQRLAASTGATSRGFLDYLGDFLETKILDGGYDLALGDAVAVADL